MIFQRDFYRITQYKNALGEKELLLVIANGRRNRYNERERGNCYYVDAFTAEQTHKDDIGQSSKKKK